jgi:hypothetical protein
MMDELVRSLIVLDLSVLLLVLCIARIVSSIFRRVLWLWIKIEWQRNLLCLLPYLLTVPILYLLIDIMVFYCTGHRLF